MPGAAARGPGAGDESLGFQIGPYRIRVATGFGPRVLGLALDDGPQMFAALPPEAVIGRPDSGVYRLHGGHRLWASPEVPEITYAPDDHPCEVADGPNQVSITGPPDRAGLVKSIAFRLADGALSVDHTLINAGPDSRHVAPWAITQVPLGGAALMPTVGAMPEGLQASHSLVLWSYTDLSDPRLSWLEEALVIDAQAGGRRFKVGTGPAPGRLGYLLEGHLFTKEFPPAGAGDYPDRGAVGQIYLNDLFCELESVGPMATLGPGSAISHCETWAVERCAGLEEAYNRIVDRVV